MKWIKPSRIDGRISAPPSKSMMLRAVAAAVLSDDETVIRNPSFCADALAGLHIAEALGCQVKGRAFGSPLAPGFLTTEEYGGKELPGKPVVLTRDVNAGLRTEETNPQTKPGAPAAVGRDAGIVRIRGGRPWSGETLPCGESGLCMRMFAPIAALSDRPFILEGTGSLLNRPMAFMEEPLRRLGAICRTADGTPPVRIAGPLQGGRTVIDGSLSSQFLTGLLMALPFCPGDSEIWVTDLKSRPYAVMTLSFLRSLGLTIDAEDSLEEIRIAGGQRFQKIDYSVEGDWSGAAFPLVAGALAGRVVVSGLEARSHQPDRRILEALALAGARIAWEGINVAVERDRLAGFDFDAADCPDLIPPLAALACHCEGRTRIFGADRLAHKESDRARALVMEFTKAGAKITARETRLEIQGGPLRAAIFDSHGDHRIAMAGAVAALRSEKGLGIEGGECVSKSYPHFFDDLKAIGGQIE